MRILFCDNNLKSFLNFRGFVVNHFLAKGWDACVVVPESTCSPDVLNRCPDRLRVIPTDVNQNSSNPLSDLRYAANLYRYLKDFKPDIVFTYTIKPNIYCSLAAKLLNIPVVAMVAGLGYVFSGNNLKLKLARRLYKLGLKASNKVIVLNQTNAQILQSNGFAASKKLILFEGGEGVDLEQFTYKADSYETIRFLMVARVLYDKGYTEYVEAAKIVRKKYPNLQIELLGPLDESSPMAVPRAVVEHDHESGVITYLGVTDDVASYLSQPGVVVVVSSYHEGFNRSLMEACAMGRICITSNIPGCKEIISNGVNGYLVEPKDSQALAEAMLHIIELEPSERAKMSIASHSKAQTTFDVKTVCDRYDAIISEFFPS